MRRSFVLPAMIAMFAGVLFAQQGPPPGPPRHPGMPGHGPEAPQPPQPGGWIRPHDTNNDGVLDAAELAVAIETTFAALDPDGNGIIEFVRQQPKPRERRPPAGDNIRPTAPRNPGLPPFLFHRPGEVGPLTRADFESLIHSVFSEMDENGDGALSIEEAAKHGPPHPAPPAPPPGAPMPPNAHFIGAELRFGDKQVKGQPFSAEIVIEETRRLYDGSIVTRENRGAIYRDAAGRTRREQPLEMVAGVPVVGKDNKPKMLVFINDFGSRSHVFLDAANKIARRTPLGAGVAPRHEPRVPPNAKSESLGTKTIEGLVVEGTRTSFEIPAGHIGNDKPMSVTTEKWFSPELQVLVSSRHVDPIGGEHVFRLVNIKRAEPVAELFSVPAGYQYQN